MAIENNSPNRILLGQLISNGDCLYATAVARQIKRDFPGCHLTWAVSSLCRRTIEENPFVDQIWEISLSDWSDELLRAGWSNFEDEALRRYEQGLYDFVFFTQIYPGNPHHFEGTVRRGIFLGYPGQITVPVQPTLVLRPEEVERVNVFALEHRLHDFEQVILFECSGKSGQTHITPEFALQAAEAIAQQFDGRHAIILSSHYTVPRLQKGIIDGSALTLREMAELTKHCSLLMGCSSGISAVASSTWAKPLPMIQLLAKRSAIFGSLAYDYFYFQLPTSHVIEMFDADVERLLNCFHSFLQYGWERTRPVYHEEPHVSFIHYLNFIETYLLGGHDYYGFCVSLRLTVQRFGWNPDLEGVLKRVASKILGQPEVNRETSPDLLLQRLMRPAYALSAASTGMTGHDPPSIRPETCLLSFRRINPELEQVLGSINGLPKDGPDSSELVTEFLDTSAQHKIPLPQYEKPENISSRLAGILALMQQADYSTAMQELIQWEQKDPYWNSQLDEILGDLQWMQGYHSRALASYQKALHDRPTDVKMRRKIDRLLIRKNGLSAIAKPKPQLMDLGLVFYAVERIDNIAIKGLVESRFRVTCSCGLETACLTASRNNSPSGWSMVDEAELQRTGYEGFFVDSGKHLDSKRLIDAAVKWADLNEKRWVALTPLDTIMSNPLLTTLQKRLAQNPAALIVEKWDFPETDSNKPGLILIRIDWWKKNRWRFLGHRLERVEWVGRYAKKLSKLTGAACLREPESRILSARALSLLLGAIASPKPETE